MERGAGPATGGSAASGKAAPGKAAPGKAAPDKAALDKAAPGEAAMSGAARRKADSQRLRLPVSPGGRGEETGLKPTKSAIENDRDPTPTWSRSPVRPQNIQAHVNNAVMGRIFRRFNGSLCAAA